MSVEALPRRVRTGVPTLHLPYPGDSPQPCAGCPAESEPVPPPETEAQLAAHRWILGHHGAFLVWRKLADALDRVIRGEHDLVFQAVEAYRAYSALLRYSGSLRREVYDAVVRPMMIAADPAFSGRWARDYERIPGLLREARRAAGPELGAVLHAASRANLLAHADMMRKLVPDGESLLRAAGDARAEPTDRERHTFDEFFLVSRGSCCETRHRTQWDAVFRGILADLDRWPLTPDAHTVVRGLVQDGDRL